MKRVLSLFLCGLLAGCASGQWSRGNAGLACPPERLGLGSLTIDLPADHGRYMAIRDPWGHFFLVHNPTVPGGIGELRSNMSGFPEKRRYATYAGLVDGFAREFPGEQRQIFTGLGPHTLLFGEHFETEYAAVVGRCTVRYTS